MPDRDPPPVGQQCPSCGRRVPRSVAKCRCGADLPTQDQYEAEAADQDTRRAWPTFLMLALIVAGAGYWTFGRPSPDNSDSPAASPAEMTTPAAPATAADAPQTLTAEQRAWNAAAALEERERPVSPPSEAPVATAASTDAGPAPGLEEMVDRAMPAIVLVETTSGRGSAFFVQYDTLITNVHVVQQDGYVTLRKMDGSSVQARVHSRAPAYDIAVLKVATPSASQPFLTMGTASSLKPGQEVIVIGSALGTLQNSVSRGIVSGVRNSGGVTLVQSDAAANPGNSGGPMLDRSGRVVGVLTAGMRGQEGLNFAVSIDHAREVLEGRQPNLGSMPTGLTNIQPVVPGGQATESERRQQQGEQEFSQRVASAAEAADKLDAAWQRFRKDCYTARIAGSYDREWFAVFVPGGIPADAAAGCTSYYQDMTREMNRFRDYMRQGLQNARRASILPGVIRDALRANRLQFDGWDR